MDTAELATRFDEYARTTETVVSELRGQIEALEQRNSAETDIEIQRRDAEAHFHRQNSDARSTVTKPLQEERSAIAAFTRTGDETAINKIHERAMSAGDDVNGGYLIIPAFSQEMTSRIRNQSPMRKLCRLVPITTGDSWEEPLDYDESGAQWPSEVQARPDTGTPQLGKLHIPVNEIYATQKVTQKLLDVSYVDLGAWLEGKISDKFARTEGLAFTSGDSIQKPQGFLSVATDSAADITRDNAKLQYVPVGGAGTAVTADALRDLYWAMRAPHRTQATWQMASSTANAIDKLKDGNGDYLWRDSSTAGVPPTLLGRPVEFNEDMPAIGANTFPVAFGDWQRGYVIVDQVGMRMLRDPYSDKPNVVFYVYRRVGGGVANTDAIKLLKIATS